MSALGHYLEEEGIPTTQISLVREHTEVLAPPRALWVPFMLGRPFGVPNDAAFQQKVLHAVLQLLEREAGPVLEDFPIDAPSDELISLPRDVVCPVSFPSLTSNGSLAERLTHEVSQLQAWQNIAVNFRGKTTLGVTGLSPTEIVDYLGSWLSGEMPETYHSDLSKGDALKHACDELRAFYYEAKAAQPGTHSSKTLHDWFWFETAAGQAQRHIHALASNSSDLSVKAVSVKSLIPRTVATPSDDTNI